MPAALATPSRSALPAVAVGIGPVWPRPCRPGPSHDSLSHTILTRFGGSTSATVASDDSPDSVDPSPSIATTFWSGSASASPRAVGVGYGRFT